jgi:uncharacterized membrane protein YfcA
MDYILISLVVLTGTLLTFFSGFGLGTLMLPVFSIFFPIDFSIAATAMVHLSNNLFKFALVYKNIHFPTFLKFGIPAMAAAILGGYLLVYIGKVTPIKGYSIGDNYFEITAIKLIIGSLMLFFAWWELSPKTEKWHFNPKHLPIGGFLSGFFGGISGHQGAFRSVFLVNSGLSKEAFIGTSNSIALLIDISRITVYINTLNFIPITQEYKILIVAIIFAFVGTFIGNKLLKKTSLGFIKKTVGIFLFIMGLLLIIGLI